MIHFRIRLLACIVCIPFLGVHAQNSSVPSSADGDYLGVAYVDLGLPSGTLWATCNMGAESPESAGDYYAWGETSPKLSFTWDNYLYGDGKHFSKYNIFEEGGPRDNLKSLLPEDDAAAKVFGGTWRIPRQEEVDELIRRCSWCRQAVNGVQGYLGTGPNGKSVFFPDSGFYEEDRFEPGTGFYWIAELVPFAIPDDVMEAIMGKTEEIPRKAFAFSPMSIAIYTSCLRKDGLSIRPVADPKSIYRTLSDPEAAFAHIAPEPGDLSEYQNYAFIWRDFGKKQQYHATAVTGEDIAVAPTYDRLLKNKAWKEYLTRIPDKESEYKEAETALYLVVMKESFQQVRERLMESRAARQIHHQSFSRNDIALTLIQEDTGYGITLRNGDYLITPQYSQIYVHPSKENDLSDRIILATLVENQPFTAYTLDEAPAEGSHCVVNKEHKLDGIGTHSGGKHYAFEWKDKEGKAYNWFVLPKDNGDISVNDFITHYLKLNTTEWLKRNEFESRAEYQARITYPYYNFATVDFAESALWLYIALYKKDLFTLDRYDIEGETFLVRSPMGNIPLKVAYDESKDFLKAWNQDNVSLEDFTYEGDGFRVKLSEISFKYKGRIYHGAIWYPHTSY